MWQERHFAPLLRAWNGGEGPLRLCGRCYGAVTRTMDRYAWFVAAPRALAT